MLRSLTGTFVALALGAGIAHGQTAAAAPDVAFAPATATAVVRVKDIATFQGAQPVPLIGYGLVIGLNKTGDRRQTIFSAQTLANMLERFGVVGAGRSRSRSRTSPPCW